MLDEAAKFTGKDLDPETGLYYFNARWMDPTTGRFVTEDPIKDGVNWYAYVSNNPLTRTDSTGLFIDGEDKGGEVYTGRAMGSWVWQQGGIGPRSIYTPNSEVYTPPITKVSPGYRPMLPNNLQVPPMNSEGAEVGPDKHIEDRRDKINAEAQKHSPTENTQAGTQGNGSGKTPPPTPTPTPQGNEPTSTPTPKDEKSKVDKLLDSATYQNTTSSKTKIYEKDGGIKQAIEDFKTLNPSDVKDIPSGKVGKLPDGRTVNVRTQSSDGRTTIEIFDGKRSVKVRYNE